MTRRIDPALIPASPTLQDFEQPLWDAGVYLVAGIDEAGRGALAGPVCAAVVLLPPTPNLIIELEGVRDSKEMTPVQRERWAKVIQSTAAAWGVGFVTATTIDQIGIVPSTRLAAQRALDKMPVIPQHLLIDALFLPENPIPQTSLLKGDARCLSIAAASVLAKVARDELLRAVAIDYPNYKLADNKGYGTRAHRSAIAKYGPTPIHRHSFAPMRFA